jgi:hypothetical protein
MTNVNTTLIKVSNIGSNKYGDKVGRFKGVTKATQNDTITIVGINEIVQIDSLKLVATGAWETHTVSGKIITCTSATGSATVDGVVIYR